MITLKVNGTEFARQLDAVARQQVPFALANTLNRTAEEAVAKKVEELPRVFTIRRRFVIAGFRVKFARKTSLTATVSHKDSFMVQQEFGGEKKPVNSKYVGDPGPFPAKGEHKAGGARPTITKATTPSKWPGRLNRRFIIRKGDMILEYVRTGRRKRVRHKSKGALVRDILLEKRGLDPGLKLMYVMKASVPIKPRLGLVDTIKQTINERFAINFDGFLKSAIRTARPK